MAVYSNFSKSSILTIALKLKRFGPYENEVRSFLTYKKGILGRINACPERVCH